MAKVKDEETPDLDSMPAVNAGSDAEADKVTDAVARTEAPKVTYLGPQEEQPPARERWLNPMDYQVLVRASPGFLVDPGGSFDYDVRFHKAIHDVAPQLHCHGGKACEHWAEKERQRVTHAMEVKKFQLRQEGEA